MTSGRDHLGDTVQDLLDGRLDAPERARAEAHLEACADCRRELETLSWVKATARKNAGLAAPDHVATSIKEALDREDAARAPAPDRGRGLPGWRPLLAFGGLLAVLAAGWLLWRSRDSGGLPARVAQDFVAYEGGRLALDLRTADVRKLEEFFAAKGVGFDVHVFDLAMMNFKAVGGRVHALDGRPTAFFVYEGPDGKILICEMLRVRLTDRPGGATVRHHNGIDFHVYQRDGLTMVFWQEGEVACVLASRGDPEEVVRLAFAKAVRSTGNEPPRGPRMAGLPGR